MSSSLTSPPSAWRDGELAEDPWRDLAAALLADGEPPPLPEAIDVAAFLAAADRHGVAGLVYGRIAGTALAARLPPELVSGLRAAAHRQTAREVVARVELERLAAAAHARGVPMLFMKGSSLAYDVYVEPAWRVRSDVDMFIRDGDRGAMRECLAQLGYASAAEVAGGLVAYQFHVERVDGRIRHLCDVHWKIANPQRFADAIGFDELAADGVALPAIGPHARGLGRAHALWLACVHRAAHHYDQDTLAWLYDVHLLVRALDDAAVGRFVTLAGRSGVRGICRRAIRLAHALFRTPTPPALLAGLDDAAIRERSAVFLQPGLRRVDILMDDLRALPDWRRRFRLLREVLFPDAVYMRAAYARGSSAPLAWLYVRRIAGGTSRWLRRGIAPTAQR